MYLPDIELHQATTLEEAAAAMARHAPDARLLAGGTDLLVDLKTRRVGAGHLVSLNRVDILRGVTMIEAGLQIGALTTISQLTAALSANATGDGPQSPIPNPQSSIVNRQSSIPTYFAPLHDATRDMAGPQIRNVATVGGNIACAVPCADLPPILIAMHALVLLWSAGAERRVPLDQFFLGARRTVLRAGEILTAVHVPMPPPGFGAAYARFALRAANSIAVAAVAASLRLDQDGIVRAARIVLGAVAPIPLLAASAGAALVGQPAGEEAFSKAADAAREAAEPISDVRGSAEFRRELVDVLARRALRTACHRVREMSYE